MCKVRALQLLMGYCVNSSWSDDISVLKTAVKGTTCSFVSSTSGLSHSLVCSISWWSKKFALSGFIITDHWLKTCQTEGKAFWSRKWTQLKGNCKWEIFQIRCHKIDYIPSKVKGGLMWVMGACLDGMLSCETQRSLWSAHPGSYKTLIINDWLLYFNQPVGLQLGWGGCL